MTTAGRGRAFIVLKRTDPGRWTNGLLLADHSAHAIEPGVEQLLLIEWSAAGEQFVEQHSKTVNVTADINVQPAHLRLLGTHVGRGADELLKLGINRFVCKVSLGCFRDAEVNHFG